MIERLCVIGVGLIGGSIAKAAAEAGICREIYGVDADGENLAKAVAAGVIAQGFDGTDPDQIAKAAEGADWVVIATPVGAFKSVLQALKPVWRGDSVYTDAGSTKLSVVAALQEVFGSIPANFVPGHPIAGAERSGVEAASSGLYQGKKIVLTPLPETDPQLTVQVQTFWQALGAEVTRMTPAHHDGTFAATSHLPHVLAFGLVHMLGKMDEQEEIFQYAGAGFRDFTRIASSSPKMWADICQANKQEILPLLSALGDELKYVAALMEKVGSEDLFQYFAEARDARQRFLYQLEK